MAIYSHEAREDCRAEGSVVRTSARGRERGRGSRHGPGPADSSDRASPPAREASPCPSTESHVFRHPRSASHARRLGNQFDRAPPGGATGTLNVYVDSSVLLRVVLGEPNRLRIWPKITNAVSSELIRLESLRTIDRARIRLGLEDRFVAKHRAEVLETVDAFSLVALDSMVLERASEPFPTLLGSLDAIHLASALLIREELEGLEFATHDDELGIAARATGFPVHGGSRKI